MRADATSPLAGRFNRHAEQLCISSLAVAEGAENSRRVAENLLRIEQFVAQLQNVLDFDAPAAADFGRLKSQLRKTPIGPFDTLIAAHARSRHMIVVTSDVGEFGRVPGLAVEDWS